MLSKSVMTSASIISQELANSAIADKFRALLKAQNPRIILGSSSYSRRLIMDEGSAMFGFSYECNQADIDEKAIRFENPEQLVTVLAQAKADAIIQKLKSNGNTDFKNAYLITGDQVVVHDDNILEKPESEEEARRFISGYSFSPPKTVGSVQVTQLDSNKSTNAIDIAVARFNPIPDEVVNKLVEEGTVFRCAGGLMVENPLVIPYRIAIEGGMDSIMGMRFETVVRLMVQLNEELN
eukprot:TRINITY_DN7482_c0_g1_i3.p1 TRINITY_DN7482_c0_g1~~TRINITY_DN7482_c0_g1_i3.p1  ORF type:complete len:238 (-),score=33.99 TRINITY_DN7482_c0_g1_i3:197-910(-)